MNKSDCAAWLLEAEIDARRRQRLQEPLLDFILRVSPTIEGVITQPPSHLSDLIDAFHRINDGEVVKAVVTLPPGSSKTETTLHALVWLMQKREFHVVYGSYNQTVADEKSLRARDICVADGGSLRQDASKIGHWRCENKSSFRAVGVGGTATGGRGDLMVIDDPIKDAEEARSPTSKAKIWRWLWSVMRTRHREHTSTILIHTRWAEDDPIGRILGMEQKKPEGEKTWEVFHLPALDENGESCVPWYSTKYVQDLKQELFSAGHSDVWWSLFQGQPRAPEGTIFKNCHTYDKLPDVGLRWGCGVDFAYTGGTSSDFNVIVVMAADENFYFIVHVEVWRGGSQSHRPCLQRIREQFPQAFRERALFLGAGSEKGASDYLSDLVEWQNATQDKLARAQPLASDWNVHHDDDGNIVGGGKILVPEDQHGTNRSRWSVESKDGSLEKKPVDAVIQHMHSQPGPFDDIMDGIVSAHKRLCVGRKIFSFGYDII